MTDPAQTAAHNAQHADWLLRVEGVRRAFGGRVAVDGVSFSLAAGETVAFLGPNGAGKSTTLRMAAGVLEPDAGDVWVSGASMATRRAEAQARLGYLPEGAPLYGDLTVSAFLGFLARAHGLAGPAGRAAVERAAGEASVLEVMSRTIETLSKGYRRRVALAGAILHDPPVLILDEPTDGLDPNQKQVMREMIARMRPKKAILISTHQLDEAEAMCNRAVVIRAGRIVADATPAALAAAHGGLEPAFQALTRTPAEAA
jgi:ABC-2 type transport system ATP-binding protein